MKNVLIFFFLFILNRAFGQNIDSLLSQKKLPDNVTVEVNHTGGDMGFPGKYIATATFKFKEVSVFYTIFPYVAADSTALNDALLKHYMMSGCNVIFNKDFSKNFSSFIKDNYYFFLEFCPCRTNENEVCAELAKRINKWIPKQ